jgi:endonuclease/exonuclease/phosphatase family metal-dependent hydrolase
LPDYLGPYGRLLETRLRVVSWNVWWRFGPWQERAPAIEATLRTLDADVVALQEVWGEPDGPSFASVLGDALGYHHVYAQRLDWDGVLFGNAILSRWPIAETEWWPLPARGDAEESRTLLYASIEGPRGAVQVFDTHLNWRFDHSDVRQEQVAFICERIEEKRPRDFPPILCGDMNASPDSTEMWMLNGKTTTPVRKLVFHDAWELAGDGPGHTWSNDNPYAAQDLEVARRIDYIYTGWPRAHGAGNVVHAEMIGRDPVEGVVPSDHYGVLADIRY